MFCGRRIWEGSVSWGAPTSVQCKTVISNNQSNPPPKEWTAWSKGVPASGVPDRASCEHSIPGSKAEWKEILKKEEEEDEESRSRGENCPSDIKPQQTAICGGSQ